MPSQHRDEFGLRVISQHRDQSRELLRHRFFCATSQAAWARSCALKLSFDCCAKRDAKCSTFEIGLCWFGSNAATPMFVY